MSVVDRWKTNGKRNSNWGQGMRWEVFYRDATGRQRRKRFDLRDEAKDYDAEQRLSPRAKAAKMTVADLHAAWLKGKTRLKPKTLWGYQSAYSAHIKPELGGRSVVSLDAIELREWFAAIESRDSARQALVVMRGMLDLAVEAQALPVNPVASLKGGQTTRREVEPLTDDQVDALAAALNMHELEFWTLVGCGLRFGEMGALTPRRLQQLDDGWQFNIARTVQEIGGEMIYGTPKGGRPRDVPVPDWLAEELRKRKGDLLLPAPDGGPWRTGLWRNPWERARNEIGRPTLHTHDLRHAFAARQIEAGVDLKTLQVVMGHAHLSITVDRYGKMAKAHIDKLADITRRPDKAAQPTAADEPHPGAD